MLAHLDGSPLTIAATFRALAQAGHDPAAIATALQTLAATKLINVLLRPYSHAAVASPQVGSPLNRLLLEEQIAVAGGFPLGSPVAGTQVLLPPPDRLALLALIGADFAQAWQRIGAAGQRVRFEGKPIDSARGLEAVAVKRLETLNAEFPLRLAQLGLIA